MAENLVHIPIAESIDPQLVADITSRPPWVTIPGTFNARDLGGNIRPGYIFRSGTLENIGNEGMQAMKDLGIKIVFDLRSEKERTENPEAELGKGMKGVWKKENILPVPKRPQTLNGAYLALLQTHAEVSRAVFRHVLDEPEKVVLIHCTAGKDRTGVIAALMHSLAQTPLEQIELDYALTRIGIEPQREFLMQKLMGSRLAEGEALDLSHPRVRMFAEPAPDAMQTFLESVQVRWGGVEGYLIEGLGFEDREVEVIKRNLRAESAR